LYNYDCSATIVVVKMLVRRKHKTRREKEIRIMVRLDPHDYKLLKKHKGCLSWRSILFRCAVGDLAWRLEELNFHLDRIASLFPKLGDVVEEFRKKLLGKLRSSHG